MVPLVLFSLIFEMIAQAQLSEEKSVAPVPPEIQSFSESTTDRDRAIVKKCFSKISDPIPPFLSVIRDSDMRFVDEAESLMYSCAELDNPETNRLAQIAQSKLGVTAKTEGALGLFVTGVTEEIPTVIFSDLLGGNDLLKAYKKELEKIGKIENRSERIRKAYELAILNQGEPRDLKTDLFSSALDTLHPTPQSTLARARRSGRGGTCREFSLLLEWSLNQVNKSPTLSKEDRTWGRLDENSFLVHRVAEPGHLWVEVLLPKGKGGAIRFDKVQLDTDVYRKVFTPLNPRHSELDEKTRQKYFNMCEKLQGCLRYEEYFGQERNNSTKPPGSSVR